MITSVYFRRLLSVLHHLLVDLESYHLVLDCKSHLVGRIFDSYQPSCSCEGTKSRDFVTPPYFTMIFISVKAFLTGIALSLPFPRSDSLVTPTTTSFILSTNGGS